MKRTRMMFLATILFLGATAPRLVAQQDEDPELTGDVVSAATGEPIAGAWVALEGWGFGTYSRRDGRFRLPEVPMGPRRYDVQALGYMSSVTTLEPTSGDQLIELDPDPSLQPGLAFVLDHLENRRNAGRVFDRQALAFSGAYNLGELLSSRGIRRVRKFCLDERWAPGLAEARPEDFYMLEIHGRTARLYTEEFLQQTAREDAEAIQKIIRLEQTVC